MSCVLTMMAAVEGAAWMWMWLGLLVLADWQIRSDVQGSRPSTVAWGRLDSSTRCLARCRLVDAPAKCLKACTGGGKGSVKLSRSGRAVNVCEQVQKSKGPAGVIPPQDTSAKFYKLRGENQWLVNITWKPLNETAWNSTNWDGYFVKYSGYSYEKDGPAEQAMETKCIVLPKTQTYYVVCESEKYWKYPETLYFNISTYPVHDLGMEFGHLTEAKPPESVLTNGTMTNNSDAVHDICNAITESSISGPSSASSTPSRISSGDMPDTYTAAVIVAGTLFGAILVVLGTLLWIRKRKRYRRLPRPSQDFEYDAFILYSSKDGDFTDNTLLPLLEDRFQFKCCVHYRDFTPGAPYVQNIVNSVLKSRKIVVVMSQNFLESTFCDYELQVAMQRLLEWRDDSVLVIKVGSLGRRQMPVLLQKRSYIDYTQRVERLNWTGRVQAFMVRLQETSI